MSSSTQIELAMFLLIMIELDTSFKIWSIGQKVDLSVHLRVYEGQGGSSDSWQSTYVRSILGALLGLMKGQGWSWTLSGWTLVPIEYLGVFCCVECKNLANVVDFFQWAIWISLFPSLFKDFEILT